MTDSVITDEIKTLFRRLLADASNMAKPGEAPQAPHHSTPLDILKLAPQIFGGLIIQWILWKICKRGRRTRADVDASFEFKDNNDIVSEAEFSDCGRQKIQADFKF